MNITKFLNEELRNIIKEFNSLGIAMICLPNSLKDSLNILDYMIGAIEENDDFYSLHKRIEDLKYNINFYLINC